MPTIFAARSALDQVRRTLASGLFRLASSILRYSIRRYERSITPPIVLRVALSAVRFLERSAALLAVGHRAKMTKTDRGANGDDNQLR